MTITSTDRVTPYEGNGATTLFPAGFTCFLTSHIKAKHYVEATGIETELTPGTDFSVAMNGLTTCDVTYPKVGSALPTLPSGEWIYVYRDVPLKQELDLRNGDDFDVELIEKQFDYLTMMVQALQEEVDRAVTVDMTSGVSPENYLVTVAALKDLAVAAKDAAVVAQGLAEHAQGDSETAAGLAEIARAASVVAKNAAEAAESACAGYQAAVQGEGTTQIGLVQSMGNAKVTLVSNAGVYHLGLVNAAGAAQVGLVEDEGDAQILRVTGEGNTQHDRVEAEGTTQVGLVQSMGNAKVTLVSNAGVYHLGLVNAAGAAQVGLVEDEGDAQILRVTGEGNTQHDRVEAEGTTQVGLVAATAARIIGTSTTSLAVAVASKTFTTQAGKLFDAGAMVLITSDADPANYMHGQVTSYSGTTLIVNVTNIGGTGTFADWTIHVSGTRGATGATGVAGSIPIAAAGGTVNAITADFTPDIVLGDMQICAVVLAGANTTATPTFAPDGLTARTITKKGGGALLPGDLPAALSVAFLEYNLANTRWELLNPAVTQEPWAVAAGTADAITATYSPVNVAVYDGLRLRFRAASANATAAPTFSPDGLTARTITKLGGSALVAGNIAGALHECVVVYNLANTRWELENPALADNSVTLAKLAHGTDGALIGFDADGAPAEVGPGTAGQILTSQGAGLPAAFASAGAGGTPVSLPYTEATADANTFVCEFNSSTDHSNETGVGLGLSGVNLVFTQVASVDKAAYGGRPIALNTQGFTCTAAALVAMTENDEWTLMHKIKAQAGTAGKYFCILVGLFYILQVSMSPVANKLMQNTAWSSQYQFWYWRHLVSMGTTETYWIAEWYKNGWLHVGFMQDAGDGVPPTGWDSFPVGQRARWQMNFPIKGNSETWTGTGIVREIVGDPSGSSSMIMTICTVIMSKLGLGVSPEAF